VRVSDETRQKINALAKSRGRSLNYVLSEAIERYLTEEEWLIDEITAAVAEADAPDAVFYTTGEVM
jgi:predicted transcriptional regulator